MVGFVVSVKLDTLLYIFKVEQAASWDYL